MSYCVTSICSTIYCSGYSSNHKKILNILKCIFWHKTCKVNVKFKPVSRQNVLVCTVVHKQDTMRVWLYVLFGTALLDFIHNSLTVRMIIASPFALITTQILRYFIHQNYFRKPHVLYQNMYVFLPIFIIFPLRKILS